MEDCDKCNKHNIGGLLIDVKFTPIGDHVPIERKTMPKGKPGLFLMDHTGKLRELQPDDDVNIIDNGNDTTIKGQELINLIHKQ